MNYKSSSHLIIFHPLIIKIVVKFPVIPFIKVQVAGIMATTIILVWFQTYFQVAILFKHGLF